MKMPPTLFALLAFFLVAGCAPRLPVVPIVPAPASHSAIDSGLKHAQDSVKSSQDSITQAQTQAHAIYLEVTNNVPLQHQVMQLEDTLALTQKQLADTQQTLLVTTNSLTYYYGAANDAWKGWSNTAVSLKDTEARCVKAESGEHWWKSKCLWTWGVLTAIAIGILVYLYGPKLLAIAAKVPL